MRHLRPKSERVTCDRAFFSFSRKYLIVGTCCTRRLKSEKATTSYLWRSEKSAFRAAWCPLNKFHPDGLSPTPCSQGPLLNKIFVLSETFLRQYVILTWIKLKFCILLQDMWTDMHSPWVLASMVADYSSGAWSSKAHTLIGYFELRCHMTFNNKTVSAKSLRADNNEKAAGCKSCKCWPINAEIV